MPNVGITMDYFAAPDDDLAAEVIQRVTGPGPGFAWRTTEERPGPFRRRRMVSSRTAPVPGKYETVDGKGIDPVVCMATLEEVLTGRPAKTILDQPRAGLVLADASDGHTLVVTVRDELRDLVAAATDERLAAVAVPWSGTDEFQFRYDPQPLADFLLALGRLARGARSRGDKLYCWIDV